LKARFKAVTRFERILKLQYLEMVRCEDTTAFTRLFDISLLLMIVTYQYFHLMIMIWLMSCTVLACLHDHFNRGRLSIEDFSILSKVIKKLSKWKKVKKIDWNKASIESLPRLKW